MRYAVVNGTDISQYINEQTYTMKREREFESWYDGNFVEHRNYTRSKVKGSFEVALWGKNGMTLDAFLTLWNAAVANDKVTILLFVQNSGTMEAVEAFFDFSPVLHRNLMNGGSLDRLTIDIVEA